MKTLSLNGSDWTLTCHWRHQWRLRPTGESVPHFQPPLPPMPAVVPGAVHADLRRAGYLPDWNAGLNSLACEWVNNRDWAFTKRFDVPADFDDRLTLEFDGLDYAGHVAINGDVIGEFEGTHLRHEFDLTGKVTPGTSVDLEVMVYGSPEIDGQIGSTSRVTQYKPRFGYYWDWCPRLVNIGIWQDVRVVSRGPGRLRNPRVQATLAEDGRNGCVTISGTAEGQASRLQYWLTDAHGNTLAHGTVPAAEGRADCRFDVDNVRAWWPATHGEQPLYMLKLELLDADDRVSDACERTIGFRRIRWLNNPAAPPDARPYVCEVNGRPIFLRGVNWVPASPFYGMVGRGQYETLLRLYRNMNANVLRVWGGGILERPEFYDLCDRLGLLVWQEFPLSSSGVDNWPPEDPDVIANLRRIAEEYIHRRGHHACHLLWCGGNELQGTLDGGKVGVGKPVDETHPCMAMFADVVNRLDAGKRFLVTSSSGPRFYAEQKEYGKGLHHDVHGPWGNLPPAERYAYFNEDDSLFRSEVGAPGCSSLEALTKNKGTQSVWPPRKENPYWLHPASWWIPWNDVAREFGPIPDDESELAFVVKASRYLQAESYRYAAEAARRRAMTCSGFIVWMGHDTIHCTANNSVIEASGRPKPAYAWIQRAFASPHVSLQHDRICYRPGEPFVGEVWVHRNAGERAAAGRVTARMISVRGEIYETVEHPVRTEGQESVHCGELRWTVPEAPYELFIVELALELEGETVSNRYLLSQATDYPLSPLRRLPLATLTIAEHLWIDKRRNRVTVANSGEVCALGVELCAQSSGVTVLAHRNSLILLPGEAAAIEYELLNTGLADSRRRRGAGVRIECFNADALTLSL